MKMVQMVSRLEGKDLVLEPLCSVCTVCVCEKMVQMVSRLEGKDLVLEPFCSECDCVCMRRWYRW